MKRDRRADDAAISLLEGAVLETESARGSRTLAHCLRDVRVAYSDLARRPIWPGPVVEK